MEARDLAQLDVAMGVIRSTLGDAVVGAYLFGSAVASGLHPTSERRSSTGRARASAD